MCLMSRLIASCPGPSPLRSRRNEPPMELPRTPEVSSRKVSPGTAPKKRGRPPLLQKEEGHKCQDTCAVCGEDIVGGVSEYRAKRAHFPFQGPPPATPFNTPCSPPLQHDQLCHISYDLLVTMTASPASFPLRCQAVLVPPSAMTGSAAASLCDAGWSCYLPLRYQLVLPTFLCDDRPCCQLSSAMLAGAASSLRYAS